jgi:hypothetical protein
VRRRLRVQGNVCMQCEGVPALRTHTCITRHGALIRLTCLWLGKTSSLWCGGVRKGGTGYSAVTLAPVREQAPDRAQLQAGSAPGGPPAQIWLQHTQPAHQRAVQCYASHVCGHGLGPKPGCGATAHALQARDEQCPLLGIFMSTCGTQWCMRFKQSALVHKEQSAAQAQALAAGLTTTCAVAHSRGKHLSRRDLHLLCQKLVNCGDVCEVG